MGLTLYLYIIDLGEPSAINPGLRGFAAFEPASCSEGSSGAYGLYLGSPTVDYTAVLVLSMIVFIDTLIGTMSEPLCAAADYM